MEHPNTPRRSLLCRKCHSDTWYIAPSGQRQCRECRSRTYARRMADRRGVDLSRCKRCGEQGQWFKDLGGNRTRCKVCLRVPAAVVAAPHGR